MGGHKSKHIYSTEVENSETEDFSSIFKSPQEIPQITHETLYSLIK
jgi:hypothetical protein